VERWAIPRPGQLGSRKRRRLRESISRRGSLHSKPPPLQGREHHSCPRTLFIGHDFQAARRSGSTRQGCCAHEMRGSYGRPSWRSRSTLPALIHRRK
jgi:hypothetical protein